MLVCDFIMLNLLNKCHGVAQLDDMAYRRSQRHVRSLETAMVRYIPLLAAMETAVCRSLASHSRWPSRVGVPRLGNSGHW